MADNKNFENRTLETIMAEIELNVSTFNGLDPVKDAIKRNDLTVALDKLIADWNELSLLTNYCKFMEAENPLMECAKQYFYPMVAKKDNKHREVVDGKLAETNVRVIDKDKQGIFSLKHFIGWAAESGVQVTAAEDWFTPFGTARKAIIAWKQAEYTEKKQMSKSKFKGFLQDMVDALIMIEGEKGGNALVVTGKNAAVCRDLTLKGAKDFLGISVAASKNFEKAAFALLHNTLVGKDFEVIYGDPEEQEPVDETENAPAESETAAVAEDAKA